MERGERRYYPGQVWAFSLRRGSTLLALDGPLRVEYRDGSLDWLPDSVPRVSITLEEGEHHVLPHSAFVEIRAAGSNVVTGLITDPQPLTSQLKSFMSLVQWIRQRFTFGDFVGKTPGGPE